MAESLTAVRPVFERSALAFSSLSFYDMTPSYLVYCVMLPDDLPLLSLVNLVFCRYLRLALQLRRPQPPASKVRSPQTSMYAPLLTVFPFSFRIPKLETRQ